MRLLWGDVHSGAQQASRDDIAMNFICSRINAGGAGGEIFAGGEASTHHRVLARHPTGLGRSRHTGPAASKSSSVMRWCNSVAASFMVEEAVSSSPPKRPVSRYIISRLSNAVSAVSRCARRCASSDSAECSWAIVLSRSPPCTSQVRRGCVIGARQPHEMLGDSPAFVFRSDAVSCRDFHVVKNHFVEFVLSVDRDDRPDLNPGDAMSISRKVIPCCGFPPDWVRTSANILFARCAPVVQSLRPVTT
jgi:hypothetical protein